MRNAAKNKRTPPCLFLRQASLLEANLLKSMFFTQSPMIVFFEEIVEIAVFKRSGPFTLLVLYRRSTRHAPFFTAELLSRLSIESIIDANFLIPCNLLITKEFCIIGKKSGKAKYVESSGLYRKLLHYYSMLDKDKTWQWNRHY